ncbi:hypothetical protein CLF_100569 [Clonorchis sinensis]|uniref:Uncharacterized protein n=1 Tax=Clonorchis sinensis TaxID=79923 RepID=G7Y3R5_CLOSI|nr:hypothetical protein CLF_100569 [Clonorchis sinensis]
MFRNKKCLQFYAKVLHTAVRAGLRIEEIACVTYYLSHQVRRVLSAKSWRESGWPASRRTILVHLLGHRK